MSTTTPLVVSPTLVTVLPVALVGRYVRGAASLLPG